MTQSRREFEKIIREIKSTGALKESILLGKEYFTKISDEISEYHHPDDIEEVNIENYDQIMNIGDTVLLISKNIKGYIIDKTNKFDEYLVQAGILKIKVDKADLKKISPEKKDYKNKNTIFFSGHF